MLRPLRRIYLFVVAIFCGAVIAALTGMLGRIYMYTRPGIRPRIEKQLIQEYNYLKTLLDASSTKQKTITPGYSDFISSEWPVMTLSLFCYGARNLALARPEYKEEAAHYMKIAIERVITPEYYHFIIDHFGDPFISEDIKDNAFYLGHVVMMLACYREATNDDSLDGFFHTFAEWFFTNYQQYPTYCLESYKYLT